MLWCFQQSALHNNSYEWSAIFFSFFWGGGGLKVHSRNSWGGGGGGGGADSFPQTFLCTDVLTIVSKAYSSLRTDDFTPCGGFL